MSISRIAGRLWRPAPRQLVWMAAAGAAMIAAAVNPRGGIVDLVIRALLWFMGTAVVGLTLRAIYGAPVDRKALLAFLPLPFTCLALFLANETAKHVTRSGSLNIFFEGALSLLGLLLVSLVVEARRVAAHDPWLRALRGWWVAFIIIGILYALLGLTPGRKAQKNDYPLVWMGLVGAIVALTVVMWRDPTQRPKPEVADPQERMSATVLSIGATSTPTRTPARSIPASPPTGPAGHDAP
jgi:hypothetical protein